MLTFEKRFRSLGTIGFRSGVADLYSKDVRSFKAFTREQEDKAFSEIDAAEFRYVRHILRHPSASDLILEAESLPFGREETGVRTAIVEASRLSKVRTPDWNRVASVLIPESRFSDTFRAWLDDVPDCDQTASGHTPGWRKKLWKLRWEKRASKARFVEANLRLVMMVAHKHVRHARTLDFLDLVQEGNMGLMRAVEKFDSRLEYRFATYAVWWIRHHVKRVLQDCDRVVRVPVHLAADLVQASHVIHKHSLQTGEKLSDEEVLGRVGATPDRIARVSALRGYSTPSIDAPYGYGVETRSLAEVMEDPDAPSPFETISSEMMASRIREAIRSLPDRESKIVELRFGLDCKEHTLQEIAEKWGLTKERIRQIEAIALNRMRQNSVLKEYLEPDSKIGSKSVVPLHRV